MKLLFIFLFLLSFELFGQKHDSILFKRIIEKPVFRDYQDTEYYSNGNIKFVGRIIRKQFDDFDDIVIPIGLSKRYYYNGQLMEYELCTNNGIQEKVISFYQNGNKELSIIYDTTSRMVVKAYWSVVTWYPSKFYIIKYRVSGIIKFEGRKYKHKKVGDWIYYDRQGNIKKRNYYY